MLSMGNPTKPWKVTKVTVENEIYNNAESAKQWLESVVPTSNVAIFIRDDFVTSSPKPTRGEATLLQALIVNGVPFNYIRLYSGNVQPQTNWTNVYYLSADAGDTYTVLYQT